MALPVASFVFPECGQPFAIVWTGETASREWTLIQWPRVKGDYQCPGMVEAEIPRAPVRAVDLP